MKKINKPLPSFQTYNSNINDDISNYSKSYIALSKGFSKYKDILIKGEQRKDISTFNVYKNDELISDGITMRNGLITISMYSKYKLTSIQQESLRNRHNNYFNISKKLNSHINLFRNLIDFLDSSFDGVSSVLSNSNKEIIYKDNPYLKTEQFARSYSFKGQFLSLRLIKYYIVDSDNDIIPFPSFEVNFFNKESVMIFLNIKNSKFYISPTYKNVVELNHMVKNIYNLSDIVSSFNVISNEEIRDLIFTNVINVIYDINDVVNENFDDLKAIVKLVNY